MEKEFLSKSAKEAIAEEIDKASGNEVFFVGTVSEEGLVDDVRAVARGNENAVPAIFDSASTGDVVIHNHPSGRLTPSEQDIQIASLFGNEGIGFYIVNNKVSQVYVVVEPFTQKEIELLDKDRIKSFLLPGGQIERVMDEKFEEREEQIEMLGAVTSAFNDNLISLVEAGTGTGKTISYLIPAISWALQNEERVVVSTNTINLQEQLIDKDLPLLRGAFDADFNYSLVKGMANYLCLLRAETVNDGLFEMAEDDEVDPIGSILEWAKVTEDGSLSDLSFSPSDAVWDKVSAESDSCLRARCPYYSRCFFFKSRRELASAQVLVVNHHLLFSDLSIKGASDKSDAGILPPYNRVIFDEAHHINDAATSHFGMRATKFGLIRVLRRLKRKGRKGEHKGLIFYTASVAAKLVGRLKTGTLNDVLKRVEQNLSPRVDAAEDYIRDAFDSLYEFSLAIAREKEATKDEVNLRLTDSEFERDDWADIDRKFSILRIRLKELQEEIKAFTDILLDFETDNDIAKLIVEFRGVGNKLDYASEVISSFISLEDDGFVRWVEGRTGRGGVLSGLGLSPLDISPIIKERLYGKASTVVMTSATMAVSKSFNFMKTGLGLTDDSRVSELILPSSFNYKEQLLLAIPDDLPEPGTTSYAGAISPLIKEALSLTNGSALILFTSYSLLETVYEQVSPGIENEGIMTLKQGMLPRSRLLDKFRKVDSSVLFATDSFWEGVDVPGSALSMVIITRLPFRVPTEPIIEARVEHMESQGLNSFMEYSLPVAVLKFKQGFGRLIRTRTDKGAVMVLDTRIISKFYGIYFLDSLPDCSRTISSSANVLRDLEDFFS